MGMDKDIDAFKLDSPRRFIPFLLNPRCSGLYSIITSRHDAKPLCPRNAIALPRPGKILEPERLSPHCPACLQRNANMVDSTDSLPPTRKIESKRSSG